jgi:choline dehydrogenase-like flavoprotein
VKLRPDCCRNWRGPPCGSASTPPYRKIITPPVRLLTIGCRAEQVPNRNSRVTLGDSTDRLGVPKLRLHWQLTARDVDGFRETQRIWAGELMKERSRVSGLSPNGDEAWQDGLAAGGHHMGTTRMHTDPHLGVVDEHCRVHGTDNLYIAGSSVFPTVGWAPPTLTIVALALRLADHIQQPR